MELPVTANTYFTERAGVLAVASVLNDLRLIWRETPNADVGIDGQVELVDEKGKATGRIVAAQVKSGKSYLRKSGDQIRFKADAKHAHYWAQFPTPVLLFIHDPAAGETYWADVRQQLLAPAEPVNPDETGGGAVLVSSLLGLGWVDPGGGGQLGWLR